MTQLKTEGKHVRGWWTRFADRTVAECADELSVIVDLRRSELSSAQRDDAGRPAIAA